MFFLFVWMFKTVIPNHSGKDIDRGLLKINMFQFDLKKAFKSKIKEEKIKK